MISTVEQAILTAVNQAIPDLKETGSLGGSWTADTLKRAIQMSPGIYVSFLGGALEDIKTTRIKGRFVVYIVQQGAIESYRRGSSQSHGAYDLLNKTIPALQHLQIPDVGIIQFEKLDNLFKDSTFKLGASVYAVQLSIGLSFEKPAPIEPRSTKLTFTDAPHSVVVP